MPQWPDTGNDGSLTGMRVLDLSQQLPGPYCSLLLASLGATVVKIEPPAGDAARELDPGMFTKVNAGKATLRLNLKEQSDRAMFHDLVQEADVVIEGYRPGVTRRLSCDYETLKKITPDLVYCSISGFGQDGPLAATPTHDISLQALAGALPNDITTDRIGVPWVDLGTATNAALAIVAAWHQGRGGYIDISMFDTAFSWANVKEEAVNYPEPTYGTLSTRDGEQAVIAILEDNMWQRLCHGLGWSDWASCPELATYAARRKRAGEVRSRLEETFAEMDSRAIVHLAVEHDVAVELIDDSHPRLEKQRQIRSRGTAKNPVVPLPSVWQSKLDPANLSADE